MVFLFSEERVDTDGCTHSISLGGDYNMTFYPISNEKPAP